MANGDKFTGQIKLITALIIVGTFLAGGVVGAGLCYWFAPSQRHFRPPRMDGLWNELGLSPEQNKKAQEIGDRRHAELEAIMHETYPKVRAIHEQMAKEMSAILTPEQQKKFDELKANQPPPMPGQQRGHFMMHGGGQPMMPPPGGQPMMPPPPGGQPMMPPPGMPMPPPGHPSHMGMGHGFPPPMPGPTPAAPSDTNPKK